MGTFETVLIHEEPQSVRDDRIATEKDISIETKHTDIPPKQKSIIPPILLYLGYKIRKHPHQGHKPLNIKIINLIIPVPMFPFFPDPHPHRITFPGPKIINRPTAPVFIVDAAKEQEKNLRQHDNIIKINEIFNTVLNS